MKERNMARADFVTSLVMIAFGIAALIMSIQMPRFENLRINPYSVPGIVPGFLGVVIALLGLAMLVRSVRSGGAKLGLTSVAFKNFFDSVDTRRIILTIFFGTAYALGLLGRVHFIVATALFVFAFVLVFELKKGVSLASQWKTFLFGALLAVVTSFAVYGVFAYLFLVNLP